MNKKEYKIPKIKSIDFVERDGLLQGGASIGGPGFVSGEEEDLNNPESGEEEEQP